jgi:hypothetical protein
MNKRKQSQMLGILFAEYQILTTEQASMVRDQMKRPLHVFSSTDTLWAFYNYITLALQTSHPRTWMEDQRILHHFISEVNKFESVSQPVPVVSEPVQDLSEPVDPLYAIPGQTNILDQIAEIENVTEETFTDELEEAMVEKQEEENKFIETSVWGSSTTEEVEADLDDLTVQEKEDSEDFDLDFESSEESDEDFTTDFF